MRSGFPSDDPVSRAPPRPSTTLPGPAPGPSRCPSQGPAPATGGPRPSRYPWGAWRTTNPPNLTQATYDRLQAELEDLTTRGRVEIARAIEAARALGDLSENGDYHAAKDTQGKMESRIRRLQHTLGHAVIVDDEAVGQLRDGGDRVGRRHPLRG